MKKVCFILLGLFSLSAFSCTQKINDQTAGVSSKLTCYFFFIPDCPASVNNIRKLNQLNKIHGEFVEFVGLLSEPGFSRSKLDSITEAYSIKFNVIVDDSLKIAKQYGASVTPEFHLYNERSELIYSGALDNYYYAIGKHRNKTTENYLEDAIKFVKENKDIKTRSTVAYGCRINLDYFK